MSLAAACGRAGFNPRVAVDGGTDTVDAAPDASPPVLACGAPVRFSITPTMGALSATATLGGYDVFAIDGSLLRGYSFQFTSGGTALAAAKTDVAVSDNAATALGAFALDDDVLVTAPYPLGDSGGTSLIPLDRELSARGTAVKRDGVFGAAGSLARSTGGSLAFLTQALGPDIGAVSAQLISPLGTDLAATPVPVEVVSADQRPNSPTITAARASFLVTWTSTSVSPNQVFARILNEALQPTSPTTLVSVHPEFTPVAPRVAYAAAADRYLFAWYEKVNSVDQLWASLRDGNLNQVGEPIMVAAQGIFPVIAAGDADFLIVWDDGNVPRHLGAARISKDGTRTLLGIASTGGSVGGWDLVVRHGQTALVWTEVGGTGPNLYIDPLCGSN